MDVLRGYILQIDLINLGGNIHVVGHAGRSDDIIQGQGRIGADEPIVIFPDIQLVLRIGPLPGFVHGGHLLHHLKESGPAGNTIGLQGRRHRQTDGFFRAGGIGHHQIGVQRIQPPGHALCRGVEGF